MLRKIDKRTKLKSIVVSLYILKTVSFNLLQARNSNLDKRFNIKRPSLVEFQQMIFFQSCSYDVVPEAIPLHFYMLYSINTLIYFINLRGCSRIQCITALGGCAYIIFSFLMYSFSNFFYSV